MGLVSALLTAFMAIAADLFGEDGEKVREFVQNMSLLRILRLGRMVRAVRMLGKWKTLWGLVKGVLNGLETMASTLVMICFTLLVFACFGVELVSRSPVLQEHDLTKEIVEKQFNSLLNIFLTLLQFVLVDGIAELYFPIIQVKPELILYFGALITFLSLMLANLVTAVLVEDAIRGSQMDEKMEEEHQKRRFQALEPKFRQAFRLLDNEDEDGQVLKTEFMNFNFKGIDGLEEVQEYLRPEKIAKLFDVLDDDDSGSITENEFINGLMRLVLIDTDLELAQTKGLVKQGKRSLKRITTCTEETLALLGDSRMLSRAHIQQRTNI